MVIKQSNITTPTAINKPIGISATIAQIICSAPVGRYSVRTGVNARQCIWIPFFFHRMNTWVSTLPIVARFSPIAMITPSTGCRKRPVNQGPNEARDLVGPVNRSTVRFTIIGVVLDSFGLEIELISVRAVLPDPGLL